MALSCRVDTASLIASACVVGNRGLGVFGSEVPSTGTSGAGYLYNDITLPGEANDEFYGLITSGPSGLTSFYAYEDSSFTAVGPDGSYSFTYTGFKNGTSYGSATASFTIGSGGTAYDVSLTEAASLTDAPAAAALFGGAMAEAATSAEVIANALQATAAVAETAAAAESASAGASTYSVSASENISAADLAAGLLALQAAVSETATAADLVASLLVAAAAIAEAAETSENASTGPQYAVTLTEAASPADALQAAAQLVGAVAEAATASEAAASAAALVALITEPASGSDSTSAGGTAYSVSLAELAAAVDLMAATLVSGGPEVYAAITTLRRQMAGASSHTRPAQRTTTRRPPQ